MPVSGSLPKAVKRIRLVSARRACRRSTGIRPSGFTTVWMSAMPSASCPLRVAGSLARSPSTVRVASYGHCWAWPLAWITPFRRCGGAPSICAVAERTCPHGLVSASVLIRYCPTAYSAVASMSVSTT